MSTDKLKRALEVRYPEESHAVLYEVQSVVDGSTRRADAVAVGLWPSRGLQVHGFEFKASRADWLREMRTPGKADWIWRYVDRWWLVTASDQVVLPGELPADWGLLTLRGSKLATVKDAPALTPRPLSRELLAAMFKALRRSKGPDAQYEKGRESVRLELASREAHAVQTLAEARRVADAFYAATGLSQSELGALGGARIGKVVRALLDGRLSRGSNNNLDGLRKSVRMLAALLDAAAPFADAVADIGEAARRG